MPGIEKEVMLKEVSKKIEGVPYIFFGKFKGLAVNDFAQLRRNVEKSSTHCFVAKNTLLKKAFASVGIEKAESMLEGSLLLVTAEKDPQILSKVLVDFAKDKESFKLAGACVEGKMLEASFVRELSRLPSRIELIAKAVGGMKSPITGFVLTLRGVLSSFVNVLDQVSKQKQA